MELSQVIASGVVGLVDWASGRTGNTPERVRAALEERFGACIAGMVRSGFLRLWEDTGQYNAQTGGRLVGAVAGLFDGRRVHLFCDCIDPGQEAAVFLHEAGGHAGLPHLLGPRRYADLIARARQLVEQGEVSAEVAALRVPGDTREEHVGEELLAYLIEEHVARCAAGDDISEAFQAWMDDLLAAVRAWWVLSAMGAACEEAGLRLELTPADIVALAELSVHWRGRHLH